MDSLGFAFYIEGSFLIQIKSLQDNVKNDKLIPTIIELIFQSNAFSPSIPLKYTLLLKYTQGRIQY